MRRITKRIWYNMSDIICYIELTNRGRAKSGRLSGGGVCFSHFPRHISIAQAYRYEARAGDQTSGHFDG